jgi:hypothetical protein
VTKKQDADIRRVTKKEIPDIGRVTKNEMLIWKGDEETRC